MKNLLMTTIAFVLLMSCATAPNRPEIDNRVTFNFEPYHNLNKEFITGKKISLKVRNIDDNWSDLKIITFQKRIESALKLNGFEIVKDKDRSDILLDFSFKKAMSDVKISRTLALNRWEMSLLIIDVHLLEKNDADFIIARNLGKIIAPNDIEFTRLIGNYVKLVSVDFFTESGISRTYEVNKLELN